MARSLLTTGAMNHALAPRSAGWSSALALSLLVALSGCGDDANGSDDDPTDAQVDTGTPTTSDDASTASAGSSGVGEPTTTAGTTADPTASTGTSMDTTDGDDTATGGAGDNPCGNIDLASGDPFTVDFGPAGSFSYEGGAQSCQMAGIHTGTWEGPDGTQLMFSAMSTTPLEETSTGTMLNVVELRWERSAGLPNGQADRFTTGMASAVVVEGGPFGLQNANDPVKLCIYDTGQMTNPAGETAMLSGPLGLSCN